VAFLASHLHIVHSGALRAADVSLVVGNWGTLDPGAQGKKRIVIHIAAAQDGTLDPDENASGSLAPRHPSTRPSSTESSASLVVFDGTMSKDNSEIDGVWK